jgi:hypothetical protein
LAGSADQEAAAFEGDDGQEAFIAERKSFAEAK